MQKDVLSADTPEPELTVMRVRPALNDALGLIQRVTVKSRENAIGSSACLTSRPRTFCISRSWPRD